MSKIPTHVEELGVDMLSVAGHKLYAPKGVGVLYVRRGVRLEPLIHGAGHETGRRAGTEKHPPRCGPRGGIGIGTEMDRHGLDSTTARSVLGIAAGTRS